MDAYYQISFTERQYKALFPKSDLLWPLDEKALLILHNCEFSPIMKAGFHVF
jgi:hypothetical protein